MIDAREFDAFYVEARQRVLRCVFLVTGDLAEAQDATQEAFVRAWQRWDRIADYVDPEAWVRMVACDRGFDVVEVARTDESTSYYSAVIRYGPEVGTGAYVLKAQFEPWEAYMEFDLERTGPADLVLGSRFQLHEVCG